MITRNRYLTPILFLIVSYLFLDFIIVEAECSSVKNGKFHFYQDKGQYHAIVIRKDSLQTEVNLSTGDSTFWRINWISDCQFTSTYISGSKIKTQEELNFYKMATLTFNILETTKKYYTYTAIFKANNFSKNFSDTMWFDAK